MRTSETIVNLAAALVDAQAEFPQLRKDRQAGSGGSYTYRYADLAQLVETTRPILAKHGLCVSQGVSANGDSGSNLDTRLLHRSGEWLEVSCPLPKADKPQDVGKVISYMRRYQEQAVLGLAAEDDDAQSAQAEATARERRPAPTPTTTAQTPPPTRAKPPQTAPAPSAGSAYGQLLDAATEAVLAESHRAQVREWLAAVHPGVKVGVNSARKAARELVASVAESLYDTALASYPDGTAAHLASDTLGLMSAQTAEALADAAVS